ncbi:cupin domain-containing protein [Nocardiopsis sp. CNR-923]|uniref:cupin domain-containing protein n=1 Tax=Nocardiopsis sp. CNR-923 TaxID=1904965 RepID=UPI0021CCDE47|nr:cupin domain-containing protein [Nocardiopsis sp. CNR-923]
MDGGPTLEVGPGDACVLREGDRTTWTVHETLRKAYHISFPGPEGTGIRAPTTPEVVSHSANGPQWSGRGTPPARGDPRPRPDPSKTLEHPVLSGHGRIPRIHPWPSRPASPPTFSTTCGACRFETTPSSPGCVRRRPRSPGERPCESWRRRDSY